MTIVPKFLVGVVSLGAESALSGVMTAIAELGNVPIDLIGAGVLAFDPWDTAARYIEKCDYVVVILGELDGAQQRYVDGAERVFDSAVERHVPVLTMIPRAQSTKPAARTFFEKLEGNPFGMMARYDSGAASFAGDLGRFINTFTRPGYVSCASLPSDNVAEQLARLVAENDGLKRRLNEDVGEAARRRREMVVAMLQENRIVIPLWYRGASGWGQPVEMTLYDFFLRMGPELAAEVSTEAAAEFIPVGVCGLEREDFRPRWPVPSNNLNLWFTDLMAIGVVEPSLRKRRSKDPGQYWTLTEEGRQLLSDIRRSVLSDGGHRHVGFTSEFRVVQDIEADVIDNG